MYFTKLKISPKSDRLLACAVPVNFYYVTAPCTSPHFSPEENCYCCCGAVSGSLSPHPKKKPLIVDDIFFKTKSGYGTYYIP